MLHSTRVSSTGRIAWLCLGLAVLAASCSPGVGQPGHEPIRVFAASSLTEGFAELAQAFEATHPGNKVALQFAGSQSLRLQIEQGAPADVFASANEAHVRELVRAGTVVAPSAFATNRLAIVVPTDNPAAVKTFDDLPSAKRIVVGTEQVPVGAYTRTMLRNAEARLGPDLSAVLSRHIVSEEPNARLVRAKVELGEADAAIVYETDARSAMHARTIDIPADVNVDATYFIGAVAGAERREGAEAWIRFVQSDQGQQILRQHGFRRSE
ncbi:MAG: molybdate ABC transporter substrate-binding protein [Myxococcota bacterium]